MAQSSEGGRRTLWRNIAIIVIVLFVALAGTAYLASNISSTATSSTPTSTTQNLGPVVDTAVNSTGRYTNRVSYNSGAEVKVEVSVPNTTHPASLVVVLDGVKQSPKAWDVNSTGYVYVLDFGGAGFAPEIDYGTHTTYSTVTFADGTTATSNTITMVLHGPVA